MAEIVGVFGVPHTPIFPFQVKSEGQASETGQLFAKVAAAFRNARPDVIVIFDTDHLNTFFLDNLPIFSIGVVETFTGPNDEPRGVPNYTIASVPVLAAHMRARAIGSGFDVALAQEFSVDHSFVVPLHFLTPEMATPVIPVFINGHVPPLPLAQRCFDLGSNIKTTIESWREPLRVAVIGTGSFSLEVWGPRIAPGRTDGVPDPDWVTRVSDLISAGQFAPLISEATEERMLHAGNVGGELLNWIAMLAFVGDRRPDFLVKQMQNGHAYAVWS